MKHKSWMIKDDRTLGKKIYKWNVPVDLIMLSKRYKKVFIGFGKWRNTKGKYAKNICIADYPKIIYLEKEMIEFILKWMKD